MMTLGLEDGEERCVVVATAQRSALINALISHSHHVVALALYYVLLSIQTLTCTHVPPWAVARFNSFTLVQGAKINPSPV